LQKFHAKAIVDQEMSYTIVGGRFSPTRKIDLSREDVLLSIAGTEELQLSVAAGSFLETGMGGFVASVQRSLCTTEILLQPFSGGDWAYSAAIKSFEPGPEPVTVSLSIGCQMGKAQAKLFVF